MCVFFLMNDEIKERVIANQNPPESDGVEILSFVPPPPGSPRGLITPPATSLGSSPRPLQAPEISPITHPSFQLSRAPQGQVLCFVLHLLACSKYQVCALKMSMNAWT